MLPWQVLRFAMNWEEMKILSERCRLFVTKALKCNLWDLTITVAGPKSETDID